MDNSPAIQVAAEVRAEMARQRHSQTELASVLGRSQQYVSRRMTGEYAFGVDDLFAIADWLAVPITGLLPKIVVAA